MKQLLLCTLTSFILIFTTCLSQAQGQAYPHNLIYVQEIEGDIVVNFYETSQAIRVHSTSGECFSESPNLDKILLFSREDSTSLSVFNLVNGQLNFETNWKHQWRRPYTAEMGCPLIDWLNNDRFLMPSLNDVQLVYSVDKITGQMTEIYPFEQEAIFIPPQIYPNSMMNPVFSPSGEQVIYNRCDSADCNGSTRFVVYDISGGFVLSELNAWIVDGGPHIVNPNEAFSWSHDGRYIAYESSDSVIEVYDLVTQSFLDLNYLPVDNARLWRSNGGMKWSPDNQKIAFPIANVTSLNYSFDTGIFILDVSNQTYNIIELPENNLSASSAGFEWSPDGHGLLLINRENKLYRLNTSDNSVLLIDNNVQYLEASYPFTQPLASINIIDTIITITESGATDTYSLALGTQPTAEVVVSVVGTDQVTVSPATLTFTPENWDVPQTVTVTAVDDSVVEGAHTAVITHSAVSADAGYSGVSVASVTVNIADDIP